MNEAVNEWLKVTAIHGLGFVALSLVAAMFIWGCFEVTKVAVRAIRQWPDWIETDIDTKRRIGKSADAITETLGPISRQVPQIHGGVTHLTKAAEAAAAKHRDHVGSDVIIHLRNAKSAMSGKEIEE